MDAKVQMIKGLDLFKDCSADEVRWAAKHGDVIDVRAGTRLVREGAYALEFVVIVDGVATSQRSGTVSILRTGAHFGSDEIVADRPHSATIEALDGLRVLAFEVRAFRGFAEMLPTVAAKLNRKQETVVAASKAAPRPGFAIAS